MLSHDKFGSHLNSKGKAIDPELEKKNFIHVGQILAEIWVRFDNQRSPSLGRINQWRGGGRNTKKTLEWKNTHICEESQYFLHIIKYLDENCYRPFRSKFLKTFKERFIPFITHSTISGLKWVKQDVNAHYLSLSLLLKPNSMLPVCKIRKSVLYDYSCPAVQDVINRWLYSACGLYLASI